ncbi:hypothetical protein ACFFIP_05840 [Fontibacter flavus]|uniref:Uncharacterized protein n=1 Tax=Fontibacter flavus TaxID=654838 RepID=A0ABV6FQT3_9BACT
MIRKYPRRYISMTIVFDSTNCNRKTLLRNRP